MVEKLRVLLSTVSSLISDPDLVQELVDACSASGKHGDGDCKVIQSCMCYWYSLVVSTYWVIFFY